MFLSTDIERMLQKAGSQEKQEILSRFFKTGKGEYGEGDQFLGVAVPQQREMVKQIRDEILLGEIGKLLSSAFHECRMTALLLLVWQYQHTKNEERKQQILEFYLAHTAFINNWDLVDLSAPYIVGAHLLNRSREVLYKLAASKNFWEQRIAIVSTLTFVRHNDFSDTLLLAEQLLYHPHDLIQKAVGWALREVGKRDFATEYAFLTAQNRNQTMPRTMLRYAIERFPENTRQELMKR